MPEPTLHTLFVFFYLIIFSALQGVSPFEMRRVYEVCFEVRYVKELKKPANEIPQSAKEGILCLRTEVLKKAFSV